MNKYLLPIFLLVLLSSCGANVRPVCQDVNTPGCINK